MSINLMATWKLFLQLSNIAYCIEMLNKLMRTVPLICTKENNYHSWNQFFYLCFQNGCGSRKKGMSISSSIVWNTANPWYMVVKYVKYVCVNKVFDYKPWPYICIVNFWSIVHVLIQAYKHCYKSAL